jgi:hypothetical protein
MTGDDDDDDVPIRVEFRDPAISHRRRRVKSRR